jgi:hypothetical protein
MQIEWNGAIFGGSKPFPLARPSGTPGPAAGVPRPRAGRPSEDIFGYNLRKKKGYTFGIYFPDILGYKRI